MAPPRATTPAPTTGTIEKEPPPPPPLDGAGGGGPPPASAPPVVVAAVLFPSSCVLFRALFCWAVVALFCCDVAAKLRFQTYGLAVKRRRAAWRSIMVVRSATANRKSAIFCGPRAPRPRARRAARDEHKRNPDLVKDLLVDLFDSTVNLASHFEFGIDNIRDTLVLILSIDEPIPFFPNTTKYNHLTRTKDYVFSLCVTQYPAHGCQGPLDVDNAYRAEPQVHGVVWNCGHHVRHSRFGTFGRIRRLGLSESYLYGNAELQRLAAAKVQAGVGMRTSSSSRRRRRCVIDVTCSWDDPSHRGRDELCIWKSSQTRNTRRWPEMYEISF